MSYLFKNSSIQVLISQSSLGILIWTSTLTQAKQQACDGYGTHWEQQKSNNPLPPSPKDNKNLDHLGAWCLTSLAARNLFAYSEANGGGMNYDVYSTPF
jgi:hypothetical protein